MTSSAIFMISAILRRSVRTPSRTVRPLDRGCGLRLSLNLLTRDSSEASRKISLGEIFLRISLKILGNSVRKDGSRMSTTRATRSISTFLFCQRSTKLGMSLAGRLSTQ